MLEHTQPPGIDWRQRALFAILLPGILLSPLPFGGMTAWFTHLFVLLCGGMLIVWAIASAGNPAPSQMNYAPLRLPLILFGICVAWCLGQAWVAVPPHIANETWIDAWRLLGTEPADRTALISANPDASVTGALRLGAYGIVFVLCYRIAAVERLARNLLALIVAAGTAYALYGISLELSRFEFVLWYKRDFEIGNLSSTFPNRNAFSNYASLCLLVCLALLYRRGLRQGDMSSGWAQGMVAFFRFYLRRNGWLIYAAVILFAAILMTHSRGGLAVAIASVMIYLVCVARGLSHRGFAVAGAVSIVLAAAVMAIVGGGGTAERFDRFGYAWVERIEIYRLTIEAIADHPVFGTGLGTFAEIFPVYRTEALRPVIRFAHNSYLENALEMGIPAATVFYTALAILLFRFLRCLSRQQEVYPYASLGVATMGAAGIHALFDYTEQFPAVVITLVAILGIAAARSFADPPNEATANRQERRSDSI